MTTTQNTKTRGKKETVLIGLRVPFAVHREIKLRSVKEGVLLNEAAVAIFEEALFPEKRKQETASA